MLKLQIIREVILWMKCSKTYKWLMMFFLTGRRFWEKILSGRKPSGPQGLMGEGKTNLGGCFSVKIFAYFWLALDLSWVRLSWVWRDHALAHCLMHDAYLLWVNLESFKPILFSVFAFMKMVEWRSRDHTLNSKMPITRKWLIQRDNFQPEWIHLK